MGVVLIGRGVLEKGSSFGLFNIQSLFENKSPFPKKSKKKLKAKLLSFLTDLRNRLDGACNNMIFRILQTITKIRPAASRNFRRLFQSSIVRHFSMDRGGNGPKSAVSDASDGFSPISFA